VVSAVRLLSLVAAALLVAGCVEVDPADGAFSCGSGGKCPNGYYCFAATNSCWHDGHMPAPMDMATVDMPPPAPSCTDGKLDGDETDVDCGGPSCSPCKVDQACTQAGDCATQSCLKGFCQLVSDSPRWIVTGVPLLSGPRSHQAGFVTSDGLLMTVGGLSDTMNTISGAVFDYKVGVGSQKTYANLPHPRIYHTCSVGPDGRFYCMGGCATTPATCTPTVVDAFDYGTNTWNSPAPAPINVGRRHAASAFAGGKLWLFGGFDGANVFNSVEVYEPGTPDSWTIFSAKPAVLPTARYGLIAVTGADDRVYTAGGLDATGTLTPSLEIFDPKTVTWKTGANMSRGRVFASGVAAPDGRIYSIGGTEDQAKQNSPSATVEAYSPATNTWVPVAKLPVPLWAGVALVGPDNRIYMMGGDSAGDPTPSATVEVYGPSMAVAPGTGTAGATNVSISGSNFAVNATVDVFFGSRSGAPFATGSSDGNGDITTPISFVIPAGAARGTAKIYAVDRKSLYPAVTTFVVQ
jgi:hypothetical protein